MSYWDAIGNFAEMLSSVASRTPPGFAVKSSLYPREAGAGSDKMPYHAPTIQERLIDKTTNEKKAVAAPYMYSPVQAQPPAIHSVQMNPGTGGAPVNSNSMYNKITSYKDPFADAFKAADQYRVANPNASATRQNMLDQGQLTQQGNTYSTTAPKPSTGLSYSQQVKNQIAQDQYNRGQAYAKSTPGYQPPTTDQNYNRGFNSGLNIVNKTVQDPYGRGQTLEKTSLSR
jgi:hypothetical protein